jgi:hypothetical protein
MITGLPQQLQETLVRGERLATTSMGIKKGQSLSEAKGWKEFCNGLQPEKAIMVAIMLENYKNYVKSLDETTKVLQVGNFDKFAYPIISMVSENLVAQDLVAVQPLSGPSGLVFYMDFVTGQAKGNVPKGAKVWDARLGHVNRFEDGGDMVPSEFLFVGTGALSVFTGNVAYRPLKPGTVQVSDGTNVSVDNGNGVLSNALTNMTAGTIDYTTGAYSITFSAPPAGTYNVSATYAMDMEANPNLQQIDFQISSSPLYAKERKLRGRWSTEAAQALEALHGMSAESQITTAIANELQFEIDREVITDLQAIAGAGLVTWDANIPAGSTISFTEHKLSFIDAVVEASNFIYRATNRVKATWILAGLQAASVIETLPTFVGAGGAAEVDGVSFLGTLNGRYKVYADPHYPVDQFLVGYKGDQFLRTGYIFAPWIMLYSTPLIILDDFIARKGFASSYGKKIVNNMYYVRGLITNYPIVF